MEKLNQDLAEALERGNSLEKELEKQRSLAEQLRSEPRPGDIGLKQDLAEALERVKVVEQQLAESQKSAAK